jgi:hypothetical protein
MCVRLRPQKDALRLRRFVPGLYLMKRVIVQQGSVVAQNKIS